MFALRPWAGAILLCACCPPLAADESPSLPGAAAPLTWDDDPASRMVDGIDRFLLRQWEAARERRRTLWEIDRSSLDTWREGVRPHRERLAHILGVRETRCSEPRLEIVGTLAQSPEIAANSRYRVLAVRWPAFADVHGEGLLLVPAGRIIADVIALPEADSLPEEIAWPMEGIPPNAQYARRLAERGCRVLIPALTSRRREKRNGRANLTDREYIYRSAFELGRHLLGYEVLKVQAGLDALHAEDRRSTEESEPHPAAVLGWGEGGLVALFTGALDERFASVGVSGAFGGLESLWSQPLDRNVFGLWERFGEAELAALVYPRALTVEAARGPELVLAGEGGAPAELTTPPPGTIRREMARAAELTPREPAGRFSLIVQGDEGRGPAGGESWLRSVLGGLDPSLAQGEGALPAEVDLPTRELPQDWRGSAERRAARQLHELDRHNQQLLRESPYVREKFMARLDTSSLEAYERSVEPYREYFAEEVIGRWEDPLLPLNPRMRLYRETEKWRSYEVALDVYPDVFAYGILLVPVDWREGDPGRPVVVCQHGLEGRPQSTLEGDNKSYHNYAARLCELGYVVFAPQNPYIFGDRFRTLQRKSNPLGRTLFSTIVPQHRQIVTWLGGLPMVDRERIAFYGLSYGGKSAMRIPPLVPEYRLSICSADFNEWVDKNASTRNPRSYMWTGEYEIFEFDLGSTFNYAEMAALICPRPFMVERGHFDGVADDWTVAHEFAKVRLLYQGRLGLKNRCEIEWFAGPHTIHGEGTFAFLARHLHWPSPGNADRQN